MDGPADLRMKRIPLNHETSRIPAPGFGILTPDAAVTIEINRIQTSQRLNTVVCTGVPGFIPKGG
jgi:hypothetical protein